MLLKLEVLRAIERGEIGCAFRRWRRPSVRSGTRLRTALGVLHIVSVEEVDVAGLTHADAVAGGYASLPALAADMERAPGVAYRITFGQFEPDTRAALGEQDEISDAELTRLSAAFARWDGAVPGYSRDILRAIHEQPGVSAALLARGFGVEKLRFKRDVRRLKDHGLTRSLEVGYALSARGEAVLKRLAGSSAGPP